MGSCSVGGKILSYAADGWSLPRRTHELTPTELTTADIRLCSKNKSENQISLYASHSKTSSTSSAPKLISGTI